MDRRLAAFGQVKRCEQALAEKQQELNAIMNTIAGEKYSKQLQEKHEAEQTRLDQVEAQRIRVLESEAHDMYWSAFQTEGYTRQ